MPKDILQKYWGVKEFRVPQKAIIDNVLKGEDVLAVLPTGSGKSACFQVPTLAVDKGVCLVISPLIALMNDQVSSLQQKGIKAIALVGSMYESEIIRHFDNLQFGETSFLYLSPERLQSPLIQEKIKQLPITLVAVDEAHCISEWGHDFRPSYLKIAVLRELVPEVPFIALTATANTRVIADISTYLKLNKPKVYNESQRRNNLSIRVIKSEDKLGNLLELLLKKPTEVGIVYAFSRKKTKQTSDFLNRNGLKTTYYHAGLSKKEKDTAYESWLSEKTPIIVATNAFGMGIDKPNVRRVIHVTVPSSLENYVQEIGRAGRDGKPSEAILIDAATDHEEMKAFYLNNLPDVAFVRSLYSSLNQFFKITYGDLPRAAFPFELASFCSQNQLAIIKTYNALQVLEREGVLEMANPQKRVTQVVFRTRGEVLFTYYKNNPKKEVILKALLRTYVGIMDSFHIVNLYKIAKKLNLSLNVLETNLIEADQDGIINFIKGDHSDKIRFLVPREDQYTINVIAENIERQRAVKIDKYSQMLAYISNQRNCRNRLIDNYFDKKETSNCGLCDTCLKMKKSSPINPKIIEESILKQLRNKVLSSRELVQLTGVDEETVISTLRELLDSNKIVLNSQNEYMKA